MNDMSKPIFWEKYKYFKMSADFFLSSMLSARETRNSESFLKFSVYF